MAFIAYWLISNLHIKATFYLLIKCTISCVTGSHSGVNVNINDTSKLCENWCIVLTFISTIALFIGKIAWPCNQPKLCNSVSVLIIE